MKIYIISPDSLNIKTIVETDSYTFNIDSTAASTQSSFKLKSRDEKETAEEIENGDIAFIPKSELKETPMESSGWFGHVRELSWEGSQETLKVADASELTDFDFYYSTDNDEEGTTYEDTEITQSILKARYTDTTDAYQILSYMIFTRGTKGNENDLPFPSYSKAGVYNFFDVLTDYYNNDKMVLNFYPEISQQTFDCTAKATIDNRNKITLNLDERFITDIKISDENNSNTNKLTLYPESGNTLGTTTYTFYLHTDGSVSSDAINNRITPVIEAQDTYSDSDYYPSGAGIVSKAKSTLKASEYSHEITFTVTENEKFPINEISLRQPMIIIWKGKSYETILTKISFSNPKQVKLTCGYERVSILAKTNNNTRDLNISVLTKPSKGDPGKEGASLTALEFSEDGTITPYIDGAKQTSFIGVKTAISSADTAASNATSAAGNATTAASSATSAASSATSAANTANDAASSANDAASKATTAAGTADTAASGANDAASAANNAAKSANDSASAADTATKNANDAASSATSAASSANTAASNADTATAAANKAATLTAYFEGYTLIISQNGSTIDSQNVRGAAGASSMKYSCSITTSSAKIFITTGVAYTKVGDLLKALQKNGYTSVNNYFPVNGMGETAIIGIWYYSSSAIGVLYSSGSSATATITDFSRSVEIVV